MQAQFFWKIQKVYVGIFEGNILYTYNAEFVSDELTQSVMGLSKFKKDHYFIKSMAAASS